MYIVFTGFISCNRVITNSFTYTVGDVSYHINWDSGKCSMLCGVNYGGIVYGQSF